MSTVRPATSRNSRCTASRSSRWRITTPAGKPACFGYLSGSSATTTTRRAPSAKTCSALFALAAPAFGTGRRGVGRTAGAENRRALNARPRLHGPLEGLGPRPALVELRHVAEPLQARNDGARHHGRRQLAGAWQEDRAGLVGLADDARPARRLDVVEQLHQLVLDKAALLFDDQNVLDALRET